MRRLPRLLLAAVLAATTSVGLAAAASATAVAQGAGCDVLVSGPSSLDGAELARANEIAGALDATREVYARARIIEGPYPGELAAWVDEQLVACPAWSTGELVLRDDMLLMVIDIEGRTAGSFFGAAVEPRLEPARNVVTDAMRPELVAAEWAGAIATGMDAYADELGIATSESPSLVPWAAGGAAVLGLGGVGAVGLRRRGRRRGAQGQAVEAKTATMSSWFDLESRWETIQAGVTIMTTAVHPDDGVAATVEQEADEAERAMGSVREELLTLPDPAEVTTQAMADEAVDAWTRVGERVAAVTTEVDEVDEAVRRLSEAKQQGPAKAQEAAAAAQRAAAAVATLERQTHDGVPLRSAAATRDAATAAAGAEAAQAALTQGRFGDAVMAAEAAAAKAAEAADRAADVPRLAVELPASAKDLGARATTALATAMASKNALTTLRSQWRRTVWDDISDAPDRAHDLAEEAQELATSAASAATVGKQDWEGALRDLEQGEALLSESAQLAAAPRARDELAKTQLAGAGQAVQAARTALGTAETAMQTTKADVTVHRQALAAAARQLDKAAGLLDDKPDPIRAQQLAAEAAGAIERASGGARQVIDAWEQVTRRAEGALQQARRELEQADRDRPRSRRFNADLRRADDLLDQAADRLDDDPGRAADDAQKALDLARRIVREKRRERDRDRDQWRTPRGGSVSGPLGGVLGGSIGGAVSRSNRGSQGGQVMGGSPSRPAPRSSPRTSKPRSSSPRRHGGGTSKF